MYEQKIWTCVGFLKDFIYLFDREHKQGEQQAEGEGEAGFQRNREPDMGLNPKTPGPWPELKTDP